MNEKNQSEEKGLEIQETDNFADNFDDVNLAALDEHIERSITDTERKIYTLVQSNAPCRVTVTENSQKKLAKMVLS